MKTDEWDILAMAGKRVVLTGNSCFMIANFRAGLIRQLISMGIEVIVLAPSDKYRPPLERMGCRVVDLKMDRNGTSLLSEILLLMRILRFLFREKPEFVFSYTIKNNLYSGICCQALGIPFVPNVTGLGPAFNQTGALNRLVRGLYRVAFSKARVVFFQNPDDRSLFLEGGLIQTEQSRLVFGSGVNLRHFAYAPYPVDRDQVIFLLPARLIEGKGIRIFVEVAREFRKKDDKLRFQLLGPIDHSSDSAIPVEHIESWVNEGVVEYLGQLEDVRPSLANADCIVLPTWYREGTPRVLLEAAAVGRPAITTNTPGCREAVLDGVNGLICEPRDRKSLAGAIKRFLEFPIASRKELGRAARARAEALFDEQCVVASYLAVLEGSMV